MKTRIRHHTDWGFRPQVNRQMQVEHVYPLSRWNLHHLIRDSCRKLSIKINSILTYAFFLLIFISFFIFPYVNARYFKLISCSYFSLTRIFPSHSCLIFQPFNLASCTWNQNTKKVMPQ